MAVTINGTTGIETNTDTGKLKAGANDDITIWHNGTDSRIDNATNKLEFRSADYVWKSSAGGHTYMEATGSEGIELYYNNVKTFETISEGARVQSNEGASAVLELWADQGDDNADKWRIVSDQSSNYFYLQNYTAGSWESTIRALGNGSIELYYNNVMTAATSSGGWDIVGWCRPGTDDTWDVGHPSYRWDDIRATNSSIVTSDKNEKNTIVDSDLGLSFVNKLKPVSYKFNGKTRTHYGLIAQDVETTLSDISKPTSGFAGFVKDDVPDELYVDEGSLPEGKKVGDLKRAAYTSYGLRYGEFISPLIKAVQELSAEVETLKTKVAALEAHTHE